MGKVLVPFGVRGRSKVRGLKSMNPVRPGWAVAYLPVFYPGFAWTTLKGKDAARDTILRVSGDFYWRQFSTAADQGQSVQFLLERPEAGPVEWEDVERAPEEMLFVGGSLNLKLLGAEERGGVEACGRSA